VDTEGTERQGGYIEIRRHCTANVHQYAINTTNPVSALDYCAPCIGPLLTHLDSADLIPIADAVSQIPDVPKIQQMRDVFKELDTRLEQLPQLHSRLWADIEAERVLMKEEWEDCVSDASTKVMKSHLDAVSEIIRIIDMKDASTKEALSTIKHQLERFEEAPRGHFSQARWPNNPRSWKT
jgi:hypothetical protein